MEGKLKKQFFDNDNFHKGHFLEDNITSSLERIPFHDCYICLKNEDIEECPYTSAYNFLMGSCDIFAYVLNQKFGYKIFEIRNKNTKGLIHAFCKTQHYEKEVYIDVRGLTTCKKEFFSKFIDEKSLIFQDVTIKECSKKLNWNDDWVETGNLFAHAIINEYYEYYSLI